MLRRRHAIINGVIVDEETGLSTQRYAETRELYAYIGVRLYVDVAALAYLAGWMSKIHLLIR